MERFSFPKTNKILNRADFVNINRSGKRHRTRHFGVIFKRNRVGVPRLGITVSKKAGNAVERNRVKRLVREFFRLNKASLPQEYDIVIVARKGASYLHLREIQKELGEVFFE